MTENNGMFSRELDSMPALPQVCDLCVTVNEFSEFRYEEEVCQQYDIFACTLADE
jgi:hypothetical protein